MAGIRLVVEPELDGDFGSDEGSSAIRQGGGSERRQARWSAFVFDCKATTCRGRRGRAIFFGAGSAFCVRDPYKTAVLPEMSFPKPHGERGCGIRGLGRRKFFSVGPQRFWNEISARGSGNGGILHAGPACFPGIGCEGLRIFCRGPKAFFSSALSGIRSFLQGSHLRGLLVPGEGAANSLPASHVGRRLATMVFASGFGEAGGCFRASERGAAGGFVGHRRPETFVRRAEERGGKDWSRGGTNWLAPRAGVWIDGRRRKTSVGMIGIAPSGILAAD